MGWYVIIGTIPIVVLGLAFKDAIRSEVRNLWVIATAMLVFSAVIAAAEQPPVAEPARRATHLARWSAGRLGAVPCTGARGVPFRLDDQRRAVPRPGPRAVGEIRLPACHSGGVRLRTVLPSRRLPSGHRGDERDRTAARCR